MASLIGKWTEPGSPLPSSHLVSRMASEGRIPVTRCGMYLWPESTLAPHVEPPATGKTCESCLRLSRRDG